jgi:hypothetical protein
LLLYTSRTTPSSPTNAASGGPNNFDRSTIDTHADQQIDLIAILHCHHLSIAPNPSIKAALEPVKLFKGIRKRGRDTGSRFAVQALCLGRSGTSGRIPQRASKVPSGLGMVVAVLPTGSVISSDCQPSKSDG